jgi:hypothetical protein
MFYILNLHQREHVLFCEKNDGMKIEFDIYFTQSDT